MFEVREGFVGMTVAGVCFLLCLYFHIHVERLSRSDAAFKIHQYYCIDAVCICYIHWIFKLNNFLDLTFCFLNSGNPRVR